MKSTTLSTARWEAAKREFATERDRVEQWQGRPLTELQAKWIWKWAYKQAKEGPCHT